MPPAEPLLIWSDPPRELLGFLATYLPLGAAGYYFAVLWPALRSGAPGGAALAGSAPRAARIGLIGVLCGALALFVAICFQAHERGLGLADTLLLLRTSTLHRVLLLAAVGAGFAVAAARLSWGWFLAAAGALVIQLGDLPEALTGRWAGIVNPVHELGGSLWLGTLFVMMVAGIGISRDSGAAQGDQDAAVGTLVRKFSAIALTGAALLGVTGVITAWRHLHRWSSLWTTPYGWTLDAKLIVVFFIAWLGFYHWRTAGPNLRSGDDVKVFRVTAWRELKLTGVVLLLTSILVSLPSPPRRDPKAEPPPRAVTTPSPAPAAPTRP